MYYFIREEGLDQALTGMMEHEVYHGLSRLLAKRRGERRELIVGMEHYLQSIDLLLSDEKRAPKHISDGYESLLKYENEWQWFNQEQSIAQWFEQKVFEVIDDLFRMRRNYKGDLQVYDQELSEILQVHNLKRAVLLSLREDIRCLEEYNKLAYSIEDSQENKQVLMDNIYIDNRVQLPQLELDDNKLSLMTVALDSEQLYDTTDEGCYTNPYLFYYNMASSHPLAREAAVETKSDQNKYQFAKMKKQTLNQLDKTLLDLGKSREGTTKMHAELEYLYQRIKSRQQS